MMEVVNIKTLRGADDRVTDVIGSMPFNEIYRIIKDYFQSIDFPNKSYKIDIYTKETGINNGSAFEMDYRVRQGKCDACLSVVITDTSINSIIACTSFIFFTYPFFEQIHFWFYDEMVGTLKKIPINELFNRAEQYVMTIGFTKTLKELSLSSKYSMTNFFLRLTQIFVEINVLMFIETTGYASLSNDLLKQETLNISDL